MDKKKFVETAKKVGIGSLIAAMIVMNGCDSNYTLPVGKDSSETVVMNKEKGPMRDWLSKKKVDGLSVMNTENLKKLIKARERKEDSYFCLDLQAVPFNLMRELGYLKQVEQADGTTRYYCQATDNWDVYEGFSMAYADTKNNKIISIFRLSFQNIDFDVNKGDSVDHHFCLQYQITYNVSEEDIKVFKYLNDDIRMNFFIQGLDEVYENTREVELKPIINHSTLCDFLPEDINIANILWYIEKVDNENRKFTIVYQTEEGLVSSDVAISPFCNDEGFETEFGYCPQYSLAGRGVERIGEKLIASKEDGYYFPDYRDNFRSHVHPINEEGIKIDNFNEKVFK